MQVMLDSCVYLDIFTQDPQWFEWSSAMLTDAADSGTIIINPVIYAEISMRFTRIEELDALLPSDVFEYCPIPQEAAFLAGKSFLRYKSPGGKKSLPLPDFFIGAHALVAGLTLITRDPKRFQAYYPALRLISP